MRSPFSVTLSVWQAIFLREALDRLFDMRGAWFWLLMEPVCHIGFIAFAYAAIQLHTIGGVDFSPWVMVGMLAFFLFRRTYIQVMYAVECNRPLFAYRQVKPFDPAIVRAGLEAFLMVFISAIILGVAAILGNNVVPSDPLLVILAISGLWLYALGFGLIASVCMELIPELEHILQLIMLPLYLISGVILPIATVPQPYRDLMMLNPIVHGLEAARLGFFDHYHSAPGVSLGYLYAWTIVSLFIGLALYRRFALKLVMR
jgi:capsular polysaccharide transport system permease protein